jgi:Arc/MetJ-type ribon-helix-helix transcriptional regulator
MRTLTVKLPQPLHVRLNALVARRGQSKSDLVREAIERLVTERKAPGGASVLDLIMDLKGAGRGPKDLASNRKYLESYGK